MDHGVLTKVQEVVADIFQVPLKQIDSDSSPETIEAWDSIQHLSLVLALEQEFGVSFAPEDISNMLSVSAIAQLITEKIAAVTSI